MDILVNVILLVAAIGAGAFLWVPASHDDFVYKEAQRQLNITGDPTGTTFGSWTMIVLTSGVLWLSVFCLFWRLG